MSAEPQTVRDHIHALQVELRAGDVTPLRARQMLVELTAWSGNCSVELVAADAAYSAVLLAHLDGHEAANRATIRAKVTPEYRRLAEAKATYALVVEMIRSLKIVLRSIDEEMRLAR